MFKNCRQRLFYHCEEPVVAVSSQSSRGCIYSTHLANLVISVTFLQPAILSNSSVGRTRVWRTVSSMSEDHRVIQKVH